MLEHACKTLRALAGQTRIRSSPHTVKAHAHRRSFTITPYCPSTARPPQRAAAPRRSRHTFRARSNAPAWLYAVAHPPASGAHRGCSPTALSGRKRAASRPLRQQLRQAACSQSQRAGPRPSRGAHQGQLPALGCCCSCHRRRRQVLWGVGWGLRALKARRPGRRPGPTWPSPAWPEKSPRPWSAG